MSGVAERRASSWRGSARRPWRWPGLVLTWALIGWVRAWRLLISPLYGDVCKFHPSCSAYGLEALHVHGWWRGGGLTVWRVLRCHPWSLGGYDPVPGTPEAAAWAADPRSQRRGGGEPPRANGDDGHPDRQSRPPI